jgi:hypothetical protein
MTSAHERRRPSFYWDLCQGISPIAVGSPRDFMIAQATVAALALIVLLLAI